MIYCIRCTVHALHLQSPSVLMESIKQRTLYVTRTSIQHRGEIQDDSHKSNDQRRRSGLDSAGLYHSRTAPLHDQIGFRPTAMEGLALAGPATGSPSCQPRRRFTEHSRRRRTGISSRLLAPISRRQLIREESSIRHAVAGTALLADNPSTSAIAQSKRELDSCQPFQNPHDCALFHVQGWSKQLHTVRTPQVGI